MNDKAVKARDAFDRHVAGCTHCNDSHKPVSGLCSKGETLWRAYLLARKGGYA